jgi:hypothetical protein
MSTLTEQQISEITNQSDLISKYVRDNFTNIKNAVNDNQEQITAISTAASDNELVQARDDHASLNDRLESINQGQFNYLKSGGVVSINGGDPQKVDVTAGEANVNGGDIIWSADTSETIPFTSANTRFDVVVVNQATTTGGLHLEIVRGAESATPVLPTVAISQKALWVLTIGTASVALGWDARNQGCIYDYEGRQKYSWKIQDAIDDLPSTGGLIKVGGGSYYETLTLKDNIVLDVDPRCDLFTAAGVSTDWSTYPVRAFDGTSIKYKQGINNDNAIVRTFVEEIGIWNMDTTSNVTVSWSSNLDISIHKILNVRVSIIQDGQSDPRWPLDSFNSSTERQDGGVRNWSISSAVLYRRGGGIFDSASFDDGAMNRGYITVTYIEV